MKVSGYEIGPGANLRLAKLSGANLTNANLTNAYLGSAIMPPGWRDIVAAY